MSGRSLYGAMRVPTDFEKPKNATFPNENHGKQWP